MFSIITRPAKTSTAWKLEVSKLRVRHEEEGKRTKVTDTEGSRFYLFLYFLLFMEQNEKKTEEAESGVIHFDFA